MDNTPFTSYEIEERSFVAFVKREIHHLALQAAFNAQRVGVIDIVVSELTSNVMKHASKGELLYRFRVEKGNGIFEIICLDNGPGMKDVNHSMKDGVSTTKTLGQGLGALERLSDVFHVYSLVGWGTIGYCKISAIVPMPSSPTHDVKIRGLNVAKPGEKVSGDGFNVIATGKETKMFMGDGLGHGKEAFDAVQKAAVSFKICQETDPSAIRFVNDTVKKTRGLVATVAIANHETKKWSICGIGNIATRVYEGLAPKNYMSYNGIIGLNIPHTLNNHVIDLTKHQTIVLTSDGIRTRWDLSQYPSILRYDPIMLAASIYKDCARKNDDMSILIGRT
jgi:anti-sigma regulatory factor (Ser/Thr protein kinase)